MNKADLVLRAAKSTGLAGLCVVCSMVVPCLASPMLTGAAAQARMEAVREEVANVRSNIFLSLVELDRVRRERDPESNNFQAFTNQLAVMERVCKAFASRAQEMRQKGDAWFADSAAKTAAIQDATARQGAEQRYAERKRSYESIIGSMQQARTSFLAFYDNLNGMKELLFGSKETAMRDLFMRANWRCIDTQRALMSMEAEFDKLAASFATDVTESQR